MNRNVQWKLLTVVVVVALSALAIYPPEDRIRLGLDLEGGVHMVLRVQTDDALRVESETAGRAARRAARAAGHHPRLGRGHRAHDDPRGRRAARAGRGVPRHRGGTADGVVRPGDGRRRHVHVYDARADREHPARRSGPPGAPDDRAARQRARRGGAYRGPVQRGRVSDPGPAAGRVRRGAREGDSFRNTALLELKIVEDGPAISPGGAARNAERRGPAGNGGRLRRVGRARFRGRRRRGLLHGAAGGRGHGAGSAQRAAVAGRVQPAGRQLLVQPRGARASSAT